jgi:hypothetical protein
MFSFCFVYLRRIKISAAHILLYHIISRQNHAAGNDYSDLVNKELCPRITRLLACNLGIALLSKVYLFRDRLCGLVVRVLGYRSGGPGSIPGTIRKKSRGSGTWFTQPREYN